MWAAQIVPDSRAVTCQEQRPRFEVAAVQGLLRALFVVHIEVQHPAQPRMHHVRLCYAACRRPLHPHQLPATGCPVRGVERQSWQRPETSR